MVYRQIKQFVEASDDPNDCITNNILNPFGIEFPYWPSWNISRESINISKRMVGFSISFDKMFARATNWRRKYGCGPGKIRLPILSITRRASSLKEAMDRLPLISKSFNSFSIAVNSSISHFFLTHSENCVSIFLIVDSSRRAIVSNQNFFPNSNLPSRLLLPLSICTQLQRTPGYQSSLVAGCCWIWRNSGWQKTRRLRLDPSGNWWCFVGYCCRRGLQKLKEKLWGNPLHSNQVPVARCQPSSLSPSIWPSGSSVVWWPVAVVSLLCCLMTWQLQLLFQVH